MGRTKDPVPTAVGLCTALPAVPIAELRSRLRLVLDSVAMLYATAPDPGQPAPLGTDDVDGQVRGLVAFAAAGMAAPPARRPPDRTSDQTRTSRRGPTPIRA